MINRHAKNKGFTLVEVMCGLVFVAIATVGLYTMYYVGYRIFMEQQHRRAVLEKAQEKMERAKYMQLSFGYVPLSEGRTGQDTLITSDNDGISKLVVNYRVSVVPSPFLNPSGIPQYSTVTVNYTWDERGNGTERRPYELSLVSAF